ncbi:LPS assembly protein LptD [SAR86 cluster bacterium]|nr:LPS assembly protein LptD [SAR86 cluster bacterium]
MVTIKKNAMQRSILLSINFILIRFILFLLAVSANLIISQDFSYSSGKASTNSKTGSLVFEENVEVKYEELIIKADKAIIDKKSKNLISENITFRVRDQLIWGKAQKVIASKDNTKFEVAEFSLCPCLEKIWWVEAKEVNLDTKNKNIDFKNAKLLVKDTPIFYFPKGSFPAAAGRRSGFLLPEISISNKSGTDISIPYYLNLAKNYDLTFEPRLISKRGNGLSSEFRYLTNEFDGFIKASFLSDDREYYDQYRQGSFRWSFNAFHNAEIFSNTFLKINYTNVGDDLFLRDFGGGFNGESESLFIPQVLKISNFGKNHRLNIKINSFKIINPIGLNQFQEIPEIDFNWFKNISDFQYDLGFKFQSFRKGGSFSDNSKQKLEKMQFSPQIKFDKYFSNFYSQIKFNYIYDIFYLNDSEISRIIPSLETLISTKFYKKNKYHIQVIKPFISFIYSKERDQSNLPIINSGVFSDSINFSKKMISGDGFIPMRNDFLIGTDFNLSKNNGGNHVFKISKLIGMKKRFLKIPQATFILPEPYQAKWSYKDKNKLFLSAGFNKDTNKNYDSFNFKLGKDFLNLNKFRLYLD